MAQKFGEICRIQLKKAQGSEKIAKFNCKASKLRKISWESIKTCGIQLKKVEILGKLWNYAVKGSNFGENCWIPLKTSKILAERQK